MEKETKWGKITVDPQVFTEITAQTVMKCFGVKGIAGTPLTATIADLLNKDRLKNGIRLKIEGDQVYLELHIIVQYGINISTLCKSIIKEVTYRVSQQTGYQVVNVDVFVDSIA